MHESNDLLVSIGKAFIGFKLRAETSSESILVETFVDSAPLIDLMSSANHQIIYGRRGTGKTHALKYVAESLTKNDDVAVYLDLRSIGSNTSIYNDYSKSLPTRASQLINDLLSSILNSLYPYAVHALDSSLHPHEITLRLDDFQTAIGAIEIRGSVESEQSDAIATTSKKAGSGSGTLSATNSLNLSYAQEKSKADSSSKRIKETGNYVLHLDFGGIRTSLEGLISVIGIEKLWIMIDEWVEVPADLQPYLADLIRRTILPTNSCVVKIAAIEHRSRFIIRQENGAYVGFEVGADISANLNLDDFLVFDSNEERSIGFFKDLIYRHYSKSDTFNDNIRSADQLINIAFTQQNVFAEFVRAVEGVPRDALNLATTVATKSYGSKITMKTVRDSARDWYHRDKTSAIKNSPTLSYALNVIVTEIIERRKVQAFMFPSNIENKAIGELFDARLLHVRKKNVSTNDEPGVRYDVFKIDFGCYVDLINTSSAPNGLFEVDDGELVAIPREDYRSIRRAILKPEMLLEKIDELDF